MEYLKEFSTENDYLGYRNSKDYLKPNVSLSDDKGSVYYNYTQPPINSNGFDYVDLGLPSGTKWAIMNVGALKPSDAGLYFQWGDTSGYTADQVGIGDGKKEFNVYWSDYKWWNESESKFTKYTTIGAKLELEDDAAHVHMGGDWHMPTPTQIKELIDNTTPSITTPNGIDGITFTSKNDTSKSIFIPKVGYANNGSIKLRGNYGAISSSMLILGGRAWNTAQFLLIEGGSGRITGIKRYCGGSVRGVIG